MSASEWVAEGDDETPGSAPPAAAEPDASAAATAPAYEPGSVLAQIAADAEEIAEDDGFKVLHVGKHPILRARYQMLGDSEVDRLRQEGQRIARLSARTRKREKSRDRAHALDSGGEDPAAERIFDSLIVATACVEILVENLETGELTPLQELLGTVAPVRYTRELAELAKLDELLGLRLDVATPAEIATAMHTWTKEKSTAPLSSAAQILKIWMGALNVEALQEALGGN